MSGWPAPAAAQRESVHDWIPRNPFDLSEAVDTSIPAPGSIIGHALGDGAVRYDNMVRYLEALASSTPRVALTRYGATHEGRALYYLTITSEANHARLDEIRQSNQRLHDPRMLESESEADRIMESLPGIAWLAYSIHGDELSSTDAALQVAYQLAAGTDAVSRRRRDELVIHIDPLMNPDGRERYLGQLQQLNGVVPSFDDQAMQHLGLWSAGRGNHYLFDLNRDWVMQVHPETRARAERILEWHPHLLVDSHEMGGLDTYLFDPPREPINPHLPEWNLQFRRRFSADQASALDRHGWSYYTQEWYEEWYPGYTNGWANLLGAVGILYEQAGVNGGAIRQASGRLLTYREAIHHHVVSSLANLDTLLATRSEFLHHLYEDRRWAVNPAHSGTEVFLVRPSADMARQERFVELLGRQGIEFAYARDSFTATDVVDLFGVRTDRVAFPAGTLVVRAAQPHRRLLHALLEFDPHVSDAFLIEERRDLENHRGSRIYDVTGWNLSMAYALDAYWAGYVGEVPLNLPPANPVRFPVDRPGYGLILPVASANLPRVLGRLMVEGCKVRVAKRAFRIVGTDFEPGAVLLRNRENPDDVFVRVRAAVDGLGLEVVGVDTALCESGPDLGGNEFVLLAPPRVAVATEWPMETTSFGAIWHLLDARMGLRCSPLNVQQFNRWDLRRYNVIVLPDTESASGLGGILEASVREKLTRWVEAGGTLIAVGGSAAFLASKDHPIGSVRLRRDVLDQLDEYDEALVRERSAREIVVDPDVVWGRTKSSDEWSKEGSLRPSHHAGNEAASPNGGEVSCGAEPEECGKRRDAEALARQDEWLRLFSPGGVIAAARVNPVHWLCFGVPGNRTNADLLPVFVSGSHAFLSKPPVATPVRLKEPDTMRMSGLMWPEARQRLGHTAYATVERLGDGQVILFSGDPSFRGYFEGTLRLLLNAILLGPGMGTDQPVPW